MVDLSSDNLLIIMTRSCFVIAIAVCCLLVTPDFGGRHKNEVILHNVFYSVRAGLCVCVCVRVCVCVCVCVSVRA